MTSPDRAAAIEQYRRASRGYDRHMRRFARWQGMAIERLSLRPGDTVIDVACGARDELTRRRLTRQLAMRLVRARAGAGRSGRAVSAADLDASGRP